MDRRPQERASRCEIGKLSDAGVHGAVARAVLAQKDIVGSGIAPTSARMPGELQQAITSASDAAFLHGLHTTMVVGAGLAFVGALLGLLVQRGANVETGDAAVA